ncbi:MAG: threonine-phosphate decarboxylase [Alphaproteobacteria bacterium]|nr:threonine-phosphate decarboxylase [Alphaproteobacteria bacterium]
MTEVPITRFEAPEAVEHGGDLGAVETRYPDAPKPWLDLSTGLNPVGYPVRELASDVWQRLPSRDALDALIDAAARRYGVVDREALVAAPGTQALIQLLPRLTPTARVAIVGPTYAEHSICWQRAGHEVAIVSDIAEAEAADVVVAVNPDNPTGRLLPTSRLRALRASLLVVDEAFIDFFPAEASLAVDLPTNTVLLRSLGKTYGLGGLRLGFAIAPLPLAGRLKEELGPWAVSGPALEVGRRALDDQLWLEGARERLRVEGERLDRLLQAADFSLLGAVPLFRLASHPEARRLVQQLGRAGVHARSFAHQPTWVRFGLPAGDQAFARLAAALQVPQKVWQTRSAGSGGSA